MQQYRVRINYIDRTGVARQLTRITYGAAEAKQLEAELMSAYSKSKEAPVSSMTLEELYAEYYITKKGEVRETSLAKINDNINASVKPYLFDIKLQKHFRCNPRPREEGDLRCLPESKTQHHFNPRPREEGDILFLGR